jgi:hypothetical protein
MKKIFLSAAAALLLAGCASNRNSPSPTDFGPAYGTDFGYKNTQLQSDRFRVSYTSRDPYQSYDFALLRAAQIATNEGYSHFQIIGGEGYDNGPNPISAGLGIGTRGRGYGRSNIGIGVGDIERTLEGRKVTETIEVILLAVAPATKDLNVFDAASIMRNIVPRNLAAQNRQPQQLPPRIVKP